MKHYRWLWIFLSVLSHLHGEAREAMLSLDECVRRALAHGFELEIERSNPLLARDRRAAADSVFVPQLVTAVAGQLAQSAGTTAPRTDDLTTTLSYSQLLPWGTTVEIAGVLNRSARDSVGPLSDPFYLADTIIRVRQPLARGANGRLIRLGQRSAAIGVEIADRNLGGQVLATIHQTENAYFALAGAREELGVVRTSLALAEKLHQEAVSRERTGLGIGLAVAQAEVGLSGARTAVLQVESSVRTAEDVLHALIGRFEFDRTLAPLESVPIEVMTLDERSIFEAAKKEQPSFRNTVATVELADLNVLAAADALKPDISLDFAAGFTGNGGSTAAALDRAGSGPGRSWQIGMSWSKPWGRGVEKAAYRSAKTARTQLELSLQRAEQALLQRVRQAIRAVQTQQLTLEVTRSGVKVAEKQYALESARFQQGLSTSRMVLQAQGDLEAARVRELQARLSLQSAHAEIRELTGASWERYGIVRPPA